LLHSGCEGIVVSPDFACAARLQTSAPKQHTSPQLVIAESESVVNDDAQSTIKLGRFESLEYFIVTNIDYYNILLDISFLRKWGIALDLSS
ncbi:hypothetical protein BU17DRAFT_30146, partial [Hysterangium stoloniferum]